MAYLGHELQLILAIALNVAVFASAWRFVARREGGTFVQRTLDAFLLYYLVQYVTVAILGVLGILTPIAVIVGGFVLSAALCAASITREPRPLVPMSQHDQLWLAGAFLFVLGFVGSYVYDQRLLPPMGTDALTYHLPVAVHWFRTQRLALFETWFYNPANTYSPLAGSTFIAWLIAPFGNDVLARFVEAGPLLMIFWAMVELCLRLGATMPLATLVAVAAVLSRPFVSQVPLAKDDLFLAAFFLVAVVGLARHASESRFAAWRVGIAVGLMLATKVTALLSAPLLVLMIDAPFRSGWRVRHWIAAIASLIVLAGPWYVRNVVLTGNPLYPTDVRLFGVTIFEGMMTPIRSRKLEGWKGWDVLTAGYFAMPVWPAWSLIAGWVVALVRRARMVGLDPVTRVAILGPVIGIALFWGKSPYAEMRFVYPSLLLLFGCVAAGMTRMGWGSILAGAFVVAVSLATSFKVPQNIVMFALVGLILAGMGALLAAMLRRVPTMMRVGTVGIILLLPIAILLANWRGYVIDGYRKNVNDAWLLSDWGELAEAWTAIRTNVPRDEVLAYTNAYLVYPLYDFELDRRIVYAPTQPGVSRLHDLPHFTRPTPGEDIPWRVEEVTWMGADRDTWLKNLDRTGATYLFIETRPIGNPEAPSVVPPELTFARQMPERFQQVFANDRAVIFRIKG